MFVTVDRCDDLNEGLIDVVKCLTKILTTLSDKLINIVLDKIKKVSSRKLKQSILSNFSNEVKLSLKRNSLLSTKLINEIKNMLFNNKSFKKQHALKALYKLNEVVVDDTLKFIVINVLLIILNGGIKNYIIFWLDKVFSVVIAIADFVALRDVVNEIKKSDFITDEELTTAVVEIANEYGISNKELKLELSV